MNERDETERLARLLTVEERQAIAPLVVDPASHRVATRLVTRAEVSLLWAEHLGSTFPDDLRWMETSAGHSIPALDASMAGCILAYVKDGTLDPQRNEILREGADELGKVLPRLKGEGVVYAKRLLEMADLICRLSE